MKRAARTILIAAFIFAVAAVFSGVATYSYKAGHTAAYANICEELIGGAWYKGKCVDPRAIIMEEPGVIA